MTDTADRRASDEPMSRRGATTFRARAVLRRRRVTTIVILILLLGMMGSSASAAPSKDQQIKDLKAQVQKLQKQIKDLKAELTKLKGPTPKPGACKAPCADSKGWQVMITNYQFDVSSDNQFIQPEEGNVYVQMDVTFANKTKKEQTASAFDFKLKDGTGVSRNEEFVGPCESWSSARLAPGASLGPKCIAFQAASSPSTGITLEWKPGLIDTYKIPLGK